MSISRGNFSYLEGIPEAEEVLSLFRMAESVARMNYTECGRDIRSILETIVNIVGDRASKNGWERFSPIEKLIDRIDILRQRETPDSNADDKKYYLPDIGMVNFIGGSGRKIKGCDGYAFVRKYGNACTHDDNHDCRKCYSNVVLALKELDKLARLVFKDQIKVKPFPFDENLMRIGRYVVTDSYLPDDAERTGCVREFAAHTLDDEGEAEFYAIIRLYERKGMDAHFLKRNNKCFTIASRSSVSVPEGLAKMSELVPIDVGDDVSEFYILVYEFNQKPVRLDDALISKMTAGQRLSAAQHVAACIAGLHALPEPIEHRMLNHECVYLCDVNGTWVPFVIKLDFAKIESDRVRYTVFSNASRAKNKIAEASLSKYFPPEWGKEGTDWAKVDDYSLGMLVCGMLAGTFSGTSADINAVEKAGFSDRLLDALDMSIGDVPALRTSAACLANALSDEIKKREGR